MQRNPIEARIAELFRDIFNDPDLVVTRETTADDVPGWDSMRHISIVVGAEEMFGIRFRTAELESLRNVGELVDLIARRVAEKRGAAAGSVPA